MRIQKEEEKQTERTRKAHLLGEEKRRVKTNSRRTKEVQRELDDRQKQIERETVQRKEDTWMARVKDETESIIIQNTERTS